MLFVIEYKKIAVILTLLLLSSCKAAKPELTSLLGNRNFNPGNNTANSGNGRAVIGSDVQGISTTFSVKSRVVPVSQETVARTTTTYLVRSNVHF